MNRKEVLDAIIEEFIEALNGIHATNEEILKALFPKMVCYIGEGEEEHLCFGFEMLSDEWVKAAYEIDREVEA
jgi:hypothetical protein